MNLIMQLELAVGLFGFHSDRGMDLYMECVVLLRVEEHQSLLGRRMAEQVGAYLRQL